MDASTFAVARLRLRGTTGNAPVVRLRAANELEAADLIPAGLSPASVLVVRRLADPLPRRFGTQHRRPRPDWERAVRSALEAAARVAARPDNRGRLDTSAPAVLFEDEAQLIACLVADRAHGRVASGWWWPSVLPRLNLPAGAAFGGSRDPAAILAARPREAPAVLSTIVRWQEIAAVAAALSVASASIVLRSISATHGLPAALVAGWLQCAVNRTEVASAGNDPDRHAAITSDSAAPWERWLPAAIRGGATAPEIQLLLGVACGLHVAPSQLRAATVVLRSEQSRSARPHRNSGLRRFKNDSDDTAAKAITRARRTPAATASDTRMTAPTSAATTSGAAAFDTAAATAMPLTPETPGSAVARGHADAPRMRKAVRTGRHVDARPAAQPADAEHTIVSPMLGADALDDRIAPASLPPTRMITPGHGLETAAVPALIVPARPTALATTGVGTRLGGLFYLIHILERLELPSAFEPAWAIGTAAGSWGVLDLIARALLGSSFSARDRAWDALAELAGWGDGPARPFRPQFAAGASDPAWVAPSGWPVELRDQIEQIAWSDAGSRVCLWSREGYVLTHRRTRGDVAAAARRARRRYEAHARGTIALERRPANEIPWLPPAMLPAGCPPRLGRWAAAAAPAVLRRLRLALGNHTASAAAVLRAPARVYATSSHVDVVFALGDIDIRVRRAGLDRNPGWLPAFGRVVYFHFQ